MKKFSHETAKLTPRVRNRAASPAALPAPSAPASPAGGRTLLQRLASYNRYREQFNPLRGLTMHRVLQLLEDYQLGMMADLQWLYHFVEQTDEDLIALIELSLSRIAEMEWDVPTNEDADEAMADEQSTYIRQQLDKIDNLEEAIEHLAMGKFRGYAHCEKWENDAGDITHLEIVDQWNAVRDGLKGGWRYNPDAIQTAYAALPAANEMPPERFLYREVRRPVNRVAVKKFVRSALQERDWDSFNSITGLPSGVVIGPPNVPVGKEAEYESSARTIADGGTGYMPNGSTYVPNKVDASEGQRFKDRLDHLSEKLVLAGTGGKLTMLTDATGLGSGASDAHTEAFDSIASAEAGRISRIITDQLVTPWLNARFPGQPHVAYFRLAANEETDTSAIITDVKTLGEAGFDLDEGEVSERTHWNVRRKQAAPAPTLPGSPLSTLNSQLQTLPAIRNRAAEAVAQDKAFLAASIADLSAADRKDQEPLLDRLAQIDAIEDDTAWLEAMRQLDADWPALLDQVLAAGGKAAVFHQIYATALTMGAIDGARQRGDGASPEAMPRGEAERSPGSGARPSNGAQAKKPDPVKNRRKGPKVTAPRPKHGGTPDFRS